MWGKRSGSVLGDFEQLVLLAVLRLGVRAYGASIRQEIHARSGRDVSISAVYTTLDRLETKGFLRSWIGEPTAPRRGGPRTVAGAVSPRCAPPVMPRCATLITPSPPWPPVSKPSWKRNEPRFAAACRLASRQAPVGRMAGVRARRSRRGISRTLHRVTLGGPLLVLAT